MQKLAVARVAVCLRSAVLRVSSAWTNISDGFVKKYKMKRRCKHNFSFCVNIYA